jgi:flagellar biosynthesis protein FlhF
MRLKVFTAKSVQAAMSEIRAALGPDAIIISTEDSGDGVIVTAAVEQAAPAAMAEPPQIPAEADRYAAREAIDMDSLRRVLAFHRLPDKLSQNVMRTALAMDVAEGVYSLAGAIDTIFSFQPLEDAPLSPLMLVGPAGSGKSLTLAKLAARAVLAGHDCLLVSTDAIRTGAAEQLASYAERLGQKHAIAADALELQHLIDSEGGERVVLVDSLGINPFKSDERAIIKTMLGKTDVMPVLVMPAGLDAEDAAEMAAAMKPLGVRHMLATRLDPGRRLGGLLAAAHAAGLYFSDVTSSPYIGDGLDTLNPVSLARLMVHCSGARAQSANRRKASK